MARLSPAFATKRELVEEIIQCGKDPVYFIDSYAKIQHPVKGLIPFFLFDYQKDALKGFTDHRLNIILKARQLGFTTVVAAFISWMLIFSKDKNILIVSTKAETAKNSIRIIRNIIKYLPKELMLCRIVVDNRQSIEMSNGSRVKAITTSADAGRSEAVSLLFVDEVAHIDKMDELWTGIFPVISTGGRAILSSTPNGTANFFYRTYKQAQNYENNFNCRFGSYPSPDNPNECFNDRFMWYVMPGRDAYWFEEETAGKSQRDIAQEYMCQFNASGDTFLPGQVLQQLEMCVSEPVDRSYEDRNLWIWQYPEPTGIYLISCDVSSGFAQDYSAFHVLRIDKQLEQVAEYKGKITADLLGELLIKVSKRYNNATIAPENNSGWSAQAIQKITDQEYPFLYYSARLKGQFIPDMYNSTNAAEAMAGYRITAANRMSMLAKVEQYIRKGDVVLHSQRLLDEFRQFIWLNAKPQAARLAHDDLIMALAGGIWIREESFMSSYKNADRTKALLASMSVDQTPVSQLENFNMSANDVYRQNVQGQNTVTLPDGRNYDITSFLISMG